jgi:hypothetical protein
VPPWEADAFRKSQYVELDTSFQALAPYVYCVPLAIHANESFPLALVIGISESVELYDLFFQAMRKFGISEEELNAKPYLSDQHTSLVSILRNRRHFFCLRHLIEKFGSRAPVGQLVRRLAFSSTKDQFLSEIAQCGCDIRVLVKKGKLELNALSRFCETFGLELAEDGSVRSLNDQVWEGQSIWARAKLGVGTCSNHIEGFHRALNRATTDPDIITRRLLVVIQLIKQRYEEACQYKHLQGARLLKKLIREQKFLRIEPCADCEDTECGWGEYYAGLMQVEWFPCIHQVRSGEVSWFRPLEPPAFYPIPPVTGNIPEQAEYQGQWTLAEDAGGDHVPMHSEKHEWSRGSFRQASFLVVLAREVSNMYPGRISYLELISNISVEYTRFLAEKSRRQDCEKSRAKFRSIWWEKVETKDLPV